MLAIRDRSTSYLLPASGSRGFPRGPTSISPASGTFGGDHSIDPPLVKQQGQPGPVDAAVVRDDRQPPGAMFQECRYQGPRNSSGAEAAHRDTRPVGDVGYSFQRVRNYLVHGNVSIPLGHQRARPLPEQGV